MKAAGLVTGQERETALTATIGRSRRAIALHWRRRVAITLCVASAIFITVGLIAHGGPSDQGKAL
jgi:hypothetical protein